MRSSPRETLSQTTSTFASLAPSKFSSQIQRRSVKGGAMVACFLGGNAWNVAGAIMKYEQRSSYLILFDVVQCCPGKNPEGKGNDLETY